MVDNKLHQESLSALMDGEASEFEVHAVLKECAQSEDARARWQRYHLVSSSLSKEAVSSPDLNLCNSIISAIAEEDAHKAPFGDRVWKPLSRFAVAASVAFVAVFSVQQFNQPESPAELPVAATDNSSVTEPVQFPSAFSVPRVPIQTVSASSVSPKPSAGWQQEAPVVVVRKVDQQPNIDEQRIEEYLNGLMLIHSEYSAIDGNQGVLPLARMPASNPDQK